MEPKAEGLGPDHSDSVTDRLGNPKKRKTFSPGAITGDFLQLISEGESSPLACNVCTLLSL